MIKYETRYDAMASPQGEALYASLKKITDDAAKLMPDQHFTPRHFGSQSYLELQVWLILNNQAQFTR